nr:hypothetical protein BJQ95_00642 [Cryobacterium sp. SO1]
MTKGDDRDLPHLPVADGAWDDAVEISGDEDWITTEPQLRLDGDPRM